MKPESSHDASKTKAAVWVPILVAALVAVGSAVGWITDHLARLHEKAVADRRYNPGPTPNSEGIS
jgi:hypothetical protein